MRSSGKKRKKALSKKDFSGLKGKFMPGVMAKAYTTMRTGGPAKGLFTPRDLAGLKELILLFRDKEDGLLPIGNGSNIIVSDKGTKKVLIRLSAPFFKRAYAYGNDIACGGGLSLSRFCCIAENNGLSGAEFLTGIPGTIGGAIACNAGAGSREISDIVKEINCIDGQGRLRTLKPACAGFGYRSSRLKGLIIVSAVLRLRKGRSPVIRNKINRHMEKRLLTQDYTAPSAGCIFKNPKHGRLSAGEIIDSCGLKGACAGGAAVSRRHANFIINRGRATTNDILRLINLVKREVKARKNFSLEEEVEIIG